jgi:hypothetical protein
MKSKAIRNILLVLLGLLSLGALAGGAVMIISPSGEILQMPLSNLDNSPFNDYLIPGLILFTVLGLMPAYLIYVLIKKPAGKFAERLNFFHDMHWAWSFVIYNAFALIIWIQVEMVYLNAVHWLHTFYMFYAVAMLFFALLPQVRNLYRK